MDLATLERGGAVFTTIDYRVFNADATLAELGKRHYINTSGGDTDFQEIPRVLYVEAKSCFPKAAENR